jgi:hypothetical protein
MAHWHGLAKLRMHSDPTLEIMDEVTTAVGYQFRHFKATVCSAYETHELPQEAEARTRSDTKRAAKQQGRQNEKQRAPLVEPESKKPGKSSRRLKVFNFQTYKFHALGDYVSTIRRYGTCDSYSTEPVSPVMFDSRFDSLILFQGELEHRSPKTRYCRTDRRTFVKQLTRIERCQTRIRRIGDRIVPRPHPEIAEIARSPHAHHHIGLTQKFPVHIGSYLRDHVGDPAINVSAIIHTFLTDFSHPSRISCQN